MLKTKKIQRRLRRIFERHNISCRKWQLMVKTVDSIPVITVLVDWCDLCAYEARCTTYAYDLHPNNETWTLQFRCPKHLIDAVAVASMKKEVRVFRLKTL